MIDSSFAIGLVEVFALSLSPGKSEFGWVPFRGESV